MRAAVAARLVATGCKHPLGGPGPKPRIGIIDSRCDLEDACNASREGTVYCKNR